MKLPFIAKNVNTKASSSVNGKTIEEGIITKF
jgi:hypothetical protein